MIAWETITGFRGGEGRNYISRELWGLERLTFNDTATKSVRSRQFARIVDIFSQIVTCCEYAIYEIFKGVSRGARNRGKGSPGLLFGRSKPNSNRALGPSGSSSTDGRRALLQRQFVGLGRHIQDTHPHGTHGGIKPQEER